MYYNIRPNVSTYTFVNLHLLNSGCLSVKCGNSMRCKDSMSHKLPYKLCSPLIRQSVGLLSANMAVCTIPENMTSEIV